MSRQDLLFALVCSLAAAFIVGAPGRTTPSARQLVEGLVAAVPSASRTADVASLELPSGLE